MKKIVCILISAIAAAAMSILSFADDGYFFAESAMYSGEKLYTNIADCGDVSIQNAYMFYIADDYILYVDRNLDERKSALHCCNKDMTNDRIIVENVLRSNELYFYNGDVYYTDKDDDAVSIYKCNVASGESKLVATQSIFTQSVFSGWITLSGIDDGYLYYIMSDFSDYSKVCRVNINNVQDNNTIYLSSMDYAYSAAVDNNKLYINTIKGIKVIDTATGMQIDTLNDTNALMAGVYNGYVYLSDDFSVWRVGSDNVLSYLSTNDKLGENTAVALSIMQDNIIYFTLNPPDYYGYIAGGNKSAVCTFDVLTNEWKIYE